jgi:nucleoside-diphosphate-sugar epimerase
LQVPRLAPGHDAWRSPPVDNVDARAQVATPGDLVLVTGASGFIGAKVVERLLERGWKKIRCFVRPSSKRGRLDEVIARFGEQADVEIFVGDLLSPDDCARASRDVCIAYHLAAGFDKSFAGAFMNSAVATRNLMDALLADGHLRRFVNVSSFAVYSNLEMNRGALLDESAPLETSPQERHDAYGFGKLKQEQLVQRYGQQRGLPYVILRPGTVFGPGKKDLTGRIGIDTFGFFIHIGGSNLLPLSYVDNCADAIVLAGLVPGIDGEIFNVVDDQLLSSRAFLKAYKRRVGPLFSLRLPYAIAYALSWLWENYSRKSHGQLPPAFNRRRCTAEWKGNRYSNQKLHAVLGWTPRVGIDEAMERFLSQFPERH